MPNALRRHGQMALKATRVRLLPCPNDWHFVVAYLPPVHAYVKNLSAKYPELVDILVEPDEDEGLDDKKKRKRFYPDVSHHHSNHVSSLSHVASAVQI